MELQALSAQIIHCFGGIRFRVLPRTQATNLLDSVRSVDAVGRYGGEEFLLCFPEADTPEVAAICEELREAVANADWESLRPDITVSLSAGVAAMRPGLTRSALVNDADRKLYQAKAAGRNLVFA